MPRLLAFPNWSAFCQGSAFTDFSVLLTVSYLGRPNCRVEGKRCVTVCVHPFVGMCSRASSCERVCPKASNKASLHAGPFLSALQLCRFPGLCLFSATRILNRFYCLGLGVRRAAWRRASAAANSRTAATAATWGKEVGRGRFEKKIVWKES